jgi:hypothetical protein
LAGSASSGNLLLFSWRDLLQVATIIFLARLLQEATTIFLARSASSGNYYFLGAICFKWQLLTS